MEKDKVKFIYLTIDDAPETWGGLRILRIFSNFRSAERLTDRHRSDDPFRYQYIYI